MIREAGVEDLAMVRELRLRALLDAPLAFESTYEGKIEWPDEAWIRWIHEGVTFIDEDGSGPSGIVRGAFDSADGDVVWLLSMWVDPRARGKGIADGLVAAAIEWARTRQARVVRLDVPKDNAHARALYERNGFRPTGREGIAEPNGVLEVEMELPLREAT
jgi:ribosomal protein S18 acetylase RimI-like enzyme